MLSANFDPQINYAALAQEIGVKDAKSASSSWHVVKKKLFAGLPPVKSGAEGSGSASASKVTKTPTPKKPRQPKTPTSATKAQEKTAAKVKAETEANEDIEEED